MSRIDGEIMKNVCKCNGNCQCGKHPCLEEDADCICKERGQSYPKMNCQGLKHHNTTYEAISDD